jgi:hypothetical protein
MAITNILATTTAGVNELRRMNSNLLNGSTSTTAITWAPLVQLDSTGDADIYIATTGTYGLAIPISEKDAKCVILIRNVGVSADKTVLVKAGNAPYYGALNNLSITATKAATATATSGTITKQTVYVETAICLDSARYLQMTGSRAGCIVILGASADVEVALVELP